MKSLVRFALLPFAVIVFAGCDELDDQPRRHHHRHYDEGGSYRRPPPPPVYEGEIEDAPQRRRHHRDDNDYGDVYREEGGYRSSREDRGNRGED